MSSIKKVCLALSLIFCLILTVQVTNAGVTGSNWFRLQTNAQTGSTPYGDGGNYYYVGQTFTATILINSTGTNAANIWVDYVTSTADISNLTTGTYFPTWSGQTISGGRLKSTGFRVSGLSSGNGNFGNFNVKALRPTAYNYGATTTSLVINVGTIGATTETNISYSGLDILESAENFDFNIWADTKKPYFTDINPANGSSSVSVDTPLTFTIWDSKNGEGDNSGVGTGVNTASAGRFIDINDGSATSSYVSYASYYCSSSTKCNASLTNAPSPSGIPGDTRKWQYNTNYSISVGGYQDFASTSQDQLGDPNGPNTASSSGLSFTTEGDGISPVVSAKTPAPGSSGVAVNTAITLDIVDKKSASVSGVGLASTTCVVDVSTLFNPATTTYLYNSSGVTVTAIPYGYRYIITPASSFGQNDTIYVNIHGCQDLASNTMVPDIFNFSTADNDPPYVDSKVPADDASMATTDNISFHIKDSGQGVDVTNTVVYIKGNYYTKNGGAGSVTTVGTRITFASSQQFSAGGSSYSCASGNVDCTFTLKPPSLTAGAGVPVIIYTRDNAGNIMERVVYSPVVGGGGCPSGSTFCGSNTSWDAGLGKCVGTGGGGGGSTGGGGGGQTSMIPSISGSSASAVQIDSSSVLITWYSSLNGSGRVIYDTVSPLSLGAAPNYGLANSTVQKDDNSTYHFMVITGLKQQTLYYFRPVTKANGNEALGPVISMAPKFPSETAICPICQAKDCPACPTITPAKPQIIPISQPVKPSVIRNLAAELLKILNFRILDPKNNKGLIVNGTSLPNSKLKLIIY